MIMRANAVCSTLLHCTAGCIIGSSHEASGMASNTTTMTVVRSIHLLMLLLKAAVIVAAK